jgi:hypothetical protein
LETKPGGVVFYDALCFLGTPGVNQTEKEVPVIAYRVGPKTYRIATNRYDHPTAEQVATIYKLRWEIEVFFSRWKRLLKGYHLIAPSAYRLAHFAQERVDKGQNSGIFCQEVVRYQRGFFENGM